MNRLIAVTLGDPEGIGPEIIYKTFSRFHPRSSVIIVGNINHYRDKNIQVISGIDEIKKRGVFFLHIDKPASETDESFGYVRKVVDLARIKAVQALVTGPISKKNWLEKGIQYKGHTDLLAHLTGVKRVGMFFWTENMKLALYTIHMPLKEIFNQIREEKIVSFMRFVNSELTRLFSKKFTFFISGLNPHAGEEGHLGDEEIKEINPAVERLAAEMDIRGILPPDTVFLKAREVRDSVVVCWYHDQGLIPFKLLHMRSGVNLTLGLPFIRTSPDHGTAFDIAGKNIADPTSMIAAVKLADDLIKRK
ncbi:MAG: 4-hydroxythreonine-4-phosphate dehydrogenase PdxA [Candidatus Aminicenantes bacterium]|nr:4-hydroxythreonine-4-phosphate dehydrogenase PdxA [Candidatus Aminicenantes bacterium]